MPDNMRAIKKDILDIIESYPAEKRYLLAMMQDVQEEYNFLPPRGLEVIAEYTHVPFSKVYSIATFYKAFSLIPKGRINFKVCDGTACHIKGSEIIVDQIYKHLGIKPGETTDDGEFSLETVNCLGACALAPVVVVNDKVHAKISSAGIINIIRSYGGLADETSE